MDEYKDGEDNDKYAGMVNGLYRKVCWFLSNTFWNNIGCFILSPTFGLGVLIM